MHTLYRSLLGLAAAATVSVGAAAETPKLSFTKDVAPILHEKCATCHRAGQMAPMSLLTYDEVRPWVKAIRENISGKKMPPWHATASAAPFTNDRSLSQAQIDTIVSWIDQGAPRGNPTDMPALPHFEESEWKLGQPDLVVKLPETEIPAEGPDVFAKLPGTVALPEDRWIKAVEINPGAPKVVHHVIMFQIKGFDLDPSGGWIGAWAAGTEPMVFPEGTGRLMQKGANLIGDMHWHPSGVATKDQTSVGLHFAKKEDVQKELVNLWVMSEDWKIPAGDPNYEIRSKYTFQQDAFILGFAPHMHYRGKDFTYTARYPDGREEQLLRVDNYDFNWQTNYVLSKRLPMPKGTTIECVAHFDNSANNPVNPDPTRDVTFGEETKDEMMIGFLDYVVADGVRPKSQEEMRMEFLTAWSKEFPADLYALKREPRSGIVTPFHLPATGEGRILMRIEGSLGPLPIQDIVWSGDTFTGRIPTNGIGEIALSGTRNPGTGELDVTLKNAQFERDIHLKGGLHQPAKPSTD